MTEGFLPTDAAPGSPEKIEVLAMRLELGLPLYHPDDREDREGLPPSLNFYPDSGKPPEYTGPRKVKLRWRRGVKEEDGDDNSD